MRRIIERVVTVVTTTTWTISWKEDPFPPEGNPDPAARAGSTADAAPRLPSVIEPKEVRPPKESHK